MSAVVLHVQLTLNPGRREEFLARARQHRANVLANEPACQCFDISVPDDDADSVRLYEVYDDQAAFDLHLGTGYMAAYLEDTGPMIAERARVQATMANE